MDQVVGLDRRELEGVDGSGGTRSLANIAQYWGFFAGPAGRCWGSGGGAYFREYPGKNLAPPEVDQELFEVEEDFAPLSFGISQVGDKVARDATPGA